MNKISKTVIGVFCASLLVVSAVSAADTSVKATNTPVVVETVKAPVTSLFNAGEVGVALSTGYDLGAADSPSFTKPYSLNVSAGAFWYPWRNFGLEVNVPFYNTVGVSVCEVQFGTLARFPLAKQTPVFKNIAPYVGIGGAANWCYSEMWTYIAKAGVEFRLNPKWGLFVEGHYRNVDFDWSQGATSIQGGLKLVF
jgi:hypothetical protein